MDSKTSDYILDIFRRLNREYGQTIIIVTHDVSLSKKVSRVVSIRDGKISSERLLKEEYRETNLKLTWQEETQEEFAVIDRAGRIQLPREYLDDLKAEDNRVRLSMENGRIIISK